MGGGSKTMLVNYRFARYVLARVYGHEAPERDLKRLIRALERHVPQYYSDRQREELKLYSKYWRREDAEPFLYLYARQMLEEQEEASRK